MAQAFPTSGDIYLGLKKLTVLGSVLYVAAHPDDENTRLLTYFSKDKLYRTGYLSLTRGDGGQNLIGDEQGIELGLIRTQELLSARRIDGAEQFFTRAYDFGFSKNPQETFTHWDKEKILSDVVWMIRKFQPDVIITRFPTTGEGGHGQHTASAILAAEAFTAAADPTRFSQQLKFVSVWQARRILWNTFNFGSFNTTSDDQFHFDVGGFNPVLGKSYGEISADSRSQHKSQGFGVPRSRGEAFEFFKTIGGIAPKNDLLEGVDISWGRVNGGAEILGLINSIIGAFDFTAPQKSLNPLVELYKKISQLPPTYWRDRKLLETKSLIEAASGLWIESFITEPYAVQGDSIRINTTINDRLGSAIKINKISLDQFDTAINAPLGTNTNYNFSMVIPVSFQKEISQPYWLKVKMKEGYYEIKDQLLIGTPDMQPAYTVHYGLTISGQPFDIAKPLRYKYSDPVKGEVYQPVFVVPTATVSTSPANLLFRNTQQSNSNISIQLSANKNLSGSAYIHLRSTEMDLSKNDSFFRIAKGSSNAYLFPLSPIKVADNSSNIFFGSGSYMDNHQDIVSFLAMRSINYDHIPSIRYFYPSGMKVLKVDLKTAGRKIGYILGAGDRVPEALEQMGYEVTLLKEKDLVRLNLQNFDAIISGVRALNTNEWMNKYYDKLMKYVEDGGNYIVQYSQANNIKIKIGPYNFSVTSKRITDENAPVSFLKPAHPVLNYPNKIIASDFSGWIQERSIYHAGNLDPHFETILRMNDPGEAPEDGSLVIAKYGKGFFSYTGLVFFRELPAGIPGAYRLIANLIALNHKKEF
ncbi:MAG: hypothetical protein NVSMB67_19210 [Flavisolibacter sp.]